MTWGIINAMEAENAYLAARLTDARAETISGSVYRSGTLAGQPVVLAVSGIGKAAAAICAQTMLTRFGAEALINTGAAGAVGEGLSVCDLVLSREVVYHDFDPALLEKYPPFTSVFRGDAALLSLAETAFQALAAPGQRCRAGRVATGDVFVEDAALKADIIARCQPDCVEMEGAAVAHAATLAAKPFLIIRSMSDSADGDAGVSFDIFLEKASETCARLLIRMLELA